MENLVLIDGNSLINRAYYATPVFTTKSGIPTNGVFGFVKLLLKIAADKKPSYMAVAFDVHAPTFRHQRFDAYKAGRKPMPDELVAQMPILKDVLHVMGIKTIEMAGYEADDIIGTLAKNSGIKTYIYTGDRDAYQLVDDKISVCFTKKGVSDLLELSGENFADEIGLTPVQIIHLKALMGDKSDNIPGVVGVGEKSALALLQQYETLEGVYEHIDEIKGALGRKLIENKETAFLSKELATINVNSPVSLSLHECVFKMPFPAALKEKFAELEFRSMLSMDIYENVKEDVMTLNEPTVRSQALFTIAEGLEKIKDDAPIAITIAEDGVRFFVAKKETGVIGEQVEYFLPFKIGLLDNGFFEYELIPFYQKVFAKGRKVYLYESKEVRHKLDALEVCFEADFDDVSIIKCLAEGLANNEKLDLALALHSLPEKEQAYGLYRLFEIYYSQLSETELKLYREVELPLTTVLFDMEKQGVCIDEERLDEFSKKYRAELQSLIVQIYEQAGEEFNINSTQQLGKILFEKLQIGAGKKKKKTTRSYSTTAEELEKYVDEHAIIPLILRYRQIQKINSTYVEGFKPLIKKGKVHTTYSQVATSTGRLSSFNPNIQNIPVRTDEGRELRKLFAATDGNVLLDADYSQIELRLLAHFAACQELIDAYCRGDDIHAITASQVFGVPLDQVDFNSRRDAKVVNFGIIYGMSAFGLGKDLGISTKKAQEYIDRYFERYSTIKQYMNNNVELAKTNGYVTTLLGRRRVINELKSSNYMVRTFGERAAMNMPLQGSSADIIKIAMINVARKLKEGGYHAKLALQIHDELIIDCPVGEVESVSRLLKDEMENAVKLSVPLTVEVGVGRTWFESK